jgi:cytochrome P450
MAAELGAQVKPYLSPAELKISLLEIFKLQAGAALGLAEPYDPLDATILYSQQGDLTRVQAGPITFYQINAPELLHEMLVEKADKFKKGVILQRVRPLVGNGLLTSDGSFWKRQRKLAQPAFHAKRIQNYAEAMVELTQKMLTEWQPGSIRNIDHDMMKLALTIVSRTLFGADLDAETSSGVKDAMTKALSAINNQINTATPAPAWLPTPNKLTLNHAIDELDQLLERTIGERRQSKEDKGDLLSMLMLATDDDGNSMSDQQLRDEAMTIFLAGHETTANALTWTFYLLSQHPDVEAKVHAELDRVLGGRAPTLADLPQLTYLEQVLKESMRLYPPASGLSREPIEDVTLGEYHLPKGAFVIASMYSLHRNPRYFPEPEQFDPERFSPENEAKLPKYAYLPFGGGPRVCIGNMFAEMEARLVLATILNRYRLTLAPGQRVKPIQIVTIRPKYGMKMQVHAR